VATVVSVRFGAASSVARNAGRRRTLRSVIRVVGICWLTVAASAAHAAPLARSLEPGTSQLDVIPNGQGTVSPDPLPANRQPCRGSPQEPVHCPYVYAPGQRVTLTATPTGANTSFVGWSDARCPGTEPCTLALTDDVQSITAMFTPLRLLARTVGAGTVQPTSSDQPCPPTDDLDLPGRNCGDYPLFTQVTLRADRADPLDATPAWLTSQRRCDRSGTTADGAPTCTVTMYSVRWTSVAFEGLDADTDIPPTVSVRFRVVKRGSGSGTVTGGSVNCGTECAADMGFGESETFVADTARGSTFVGWRGACSRAPRCSLAVGPVTYLVAVFDASEEGKPPSPSPAQPPGARFVARVRRLSVSGHGRQRKIMVRVQVSAPATIRGTLSRGGRRVASRRWRVAAGTPLLRMRVPARARPGIYRLRLSLRDEAGHVTRVKRRVRLPR
jgi:hypothetical protein